MLGELRAPTIMDRGNGVCGRVAGDKAGGRYGQGCANEFTFCLEGRE